MDDDIGFQYEYYDLEVLHAFCDSLEIKCLNRDLKAFNFFSSKDRLSLICLLLTHLCIVVLQHG